MPRISAIAECVCALTRPGISTCDASTRVSRAAIGRVGGLGGTIATIAPRVDENGVAGEHAGGFDGNDPARVDAQVDGLHRGHRSGRPEKEAPREAGLRRSLPWT